MACGLFSLIILLRSYSFPASGGARPSASRGPNVCHLGCCLRPSGGWPSDQIYCPDWALVAICQRNMRHTVTSGTRDDEIPDVSEEDEDEDLIPSDLVGPSLRRREPPPSTTSSTTSSFINGLEIVSLPQDPHDELPERSEEDDGKDRSPRDLVRSSFRRYEPPPPTTSSVTSAFINGLGNFSFPYDSHDDGYQLSQELNRSQMQKLPVQIKARQSDHLFAMHESTKMSSRLVQTYFMHYFHGLASSSLKTGTTTLRLPCRPELSDTSCRKAASECEQAAHQNGQRDSS